MSWPTELRSEFEKWERVFLVLGRSENRGELAASLMPQWKESIATLRNIHERASKSQVAAELAPLTSFLIPIVPRDQQLFAWGATHRRIEELLAVRALIDGILVSEEPGWAERVETAILHLQRLLAVDEALRSRWQTAWNDATEPALERLGGVHFLHHQLYAFKAESPGAATDLVVGVALGGHQQIEASEPVRARTPLVLTEWKKVAGEADVAAKLEQARVQLEKYPKTAAASLELRQTRFAVLVSEAELSGFPAEQRLADGSTMRVVNIAIEPSSVSVQAKKK